MNRSKIRNYILSIYLLRGCIAGCIAAMIVLLTGVRMNAWHYAPTSFVPSILLMFLFVVVGFVIGALFEIHRIDRSILVQEFTGSDFDAEPLQELADSETFFVNSSFLMFHKDLRFQVFHKSNLARVDNVGMEPKPGNAYARIHITLKNGKEETLPYRISSEVRFANALVNWVCPQEAPAPTGICSACGAKNEPDTEFCAWCGTRLVDPHTASCEELGYVPCQPKSECVPPLEEPKKEVHRKYITFWIVFGIVIVLIVLLVLGMEQASHPHYWGNHW